MELGNMCFGNSRGTFSVDRHMFERLFSPLFECLDMEVENYWGYVPEFKNEVFTTFPYYWGHCTCGYAEVEEEWHQTHYHALDCYQIDLYREKLNCGWISDKWGWLTPPSEWSREYVAKCEDVVYRKLYREHGIPENNLAGCEIHCTCNYKEEWAQWRKTHDHSENCPIVRPNFLHKPSGFEIQWYKYPFRDAYVNLDLSKEEIRRIVWDCVDSLRQPKGK